MVDQDGLWEGIREREHLVIPQLKSRSLTDLIDSFDDYWRVASKLMPTTGPPTRSTSPPPMGSALSRPLSTDNNVPERDGAYTVRSVPVRMYLPDGPVLQELAPPLLDDGELPRNPPLQNYDILIYRFPLQDHQILSPISSQPICHCYFLHGLRRLHLLG